MKHIYPYFRPLKKGIEVGYITVEKGKIINKEILGKSVTTIDPSDCHMKLEVNGIISLYRPVGKQPKWDSQYCLSAMRVQSQEAI